MVWGGVGVWAPPASWAPRADVRVRGSIEALCRALVWFTVTAVVTDLITVLFYLQGLGEGPNVKILYQGVGESLTPVAMGGAFLSLIWVLMAIGQRRADVRV
jgi:hypothetical protein